MRLVSPEDDQDGWHSGINGLHIKATNGTEARAPTTCAHELLERASETYPDNIALVCGDSTLTFGELNSLSNSVAKALIDRGVSHGDLVGVALDRSVELVAALIGVLKTGAAYVPIDPTLPEERISYMVEDAAPKILITQTPSMAVSGGAITISVDSIKSSGSPDANITVSPTALAYVMYTSGSTGRPKGVEVTHTNIVNLLQSMQKEPGCKPTDRLLAITTVSFDMAVVELFLPLFTGATVVIAQRHEVRDPAALVALMKRHKVTIMQGTPAIWQMLLDSGWCGEPRLEKIISGGEALPRVLADRLLECTDEMWNMYGPTEVTVYASIWKVKRGGEVTIGGPLENYHLYVLDDKLSPVPRGNQGEVCVGGVGVAQGYRNRSALSEEKFVRNPFHGGMMYRTGDLGRFLDSGELAIMGRMDGQVKIRGHRVEVGDIEAAIARHECVSGAAVVCRDDRLVAYFVPKTATKPNTEPLDRVLRPWLAERLPGYMVPAFIVEIESFPVTPNGKIDRKALPEPGTLIRTSPPPANVGATDMEGMIFRVWSKVLGHDNFRAEDSFFDVGGDSVRLVRVQKELEVLLGLPISVPNLFEYFTIKALATHLVGSSEKHEQKAQPTLSPSASGDIAIVSMACRLPGGVTTPEEFWELLENGDEAITEVPRDRWDANALYDESPQAAGKSYCRYGGFVSDIESFDAAFFGISPREARSLDPAQYLMLETCWEGFERAGYTTDQLRGSQTGVFIGTSNILGHLALHKDGSKDVADFDGYTVTGTAGGTMSGRISYQLGLQGPTMTIDTACSSSLVTTHLACTALRQGECDLAVSGGVSLMLNPGLHVEFSRLQGMSPDGRCRAFSADTQGTGWSEGSVAVVLKRLSDAQRDGDTIHGVIRGSAVNHDGRSASLTTPSGAAQQRLVRTALSAAKLQPSDIDYVEAHGTGTKLGDPIEATALGEVFGPGRATGEPLFIGSAKSNIGHTQAAAGLVGLLKVTLAIQNGMLPETLHVTKPTPAVDWQGANMMPVMSNRTWLAKQMRPRRAGISAFGIGGTNAHVIVEEPPRRATNGDAPVRKVATRLPDRLPFLLSGDSDVALREQADKLHRHIISTTDGLSDMAYSLTTTRSHFRKRLVLTARDETDLLGQLSAIAREEPVCDTVEATKLAMLFTGQGSQYPGMGKDLAKTYPVFDKAIREIAVQFDAELTVPLLEVMWGEPESAIAALLDRTDFSQPALFALEVALWRLWKSWGVSPEFVLGHSLGELVAAHVAGVFDLSDGCRLVAARGRLMQAQAGNYGMVSLEASAEETAVAIERLGRGAEVEVALHNTTDQTVISGVKDAVDEIARDFAARGRKAKTIVVGHAFHSRFMDGMIKEFRAVAATVDFNAPCLKIISSVSGREIEPGEMEKSGYWAKQIREPVRFADAIQTLGRHNVNVFLELGPQQVLCGMGAACLSVSGKNHLQPALWMPSLTRDKDNTLLLQRSLSHLHMRHVSIDWENYFKPFGCQRVQLPTYAFQRKPVVRTWAHSQEGTVASSTNSDTDSGNMDRQARKNYLEGLQFGISWRQVQGTGHGPSGTWGYVVPASNNTLWVEQMIAGLHAAHLALVHLEKFEDTAQQSEKLDGVFCLWDSEAAVIQQAEELVPIALGQLQMAARTQFSLPIVWLTNHAIGMGEKSDDRDIKPGVGPLLWGLARTTRSEHPELRLRLIDLPKDMWYTSIASALSIESEPECAVRRHQVYVPRMGPIWSPPKPENEPPMIRTDGAVLITGGLGYLGKCVARRLVRDHGVRHLVLISRRGTEAPGADTLTAELEKHGAKVTIFALDIANADDVNKVMKIFNKSYPLRGVIHAAGVSDSGVLSSMTGDRCATTIAPKVHGAWLLHEATQKMDLDLFVMFSSISGVLGMAGLANYAAANNFLDALAYLRRGNRLPATTVAYGTWAGDAGMASKLARTAHSHLAQFGLGPLPPHDGLGVLEYAVRTHRPLTVGAVLDLERIRSYYEEQSGGVPPLLRELLPKTQGPSTKTSASTRIDLRKMLRQFKADRHYDIVLGMVRRVVAKTLGFTNPDEVEVNRPLKEIGIDSLTAVQVRNSLASLTDLTLSANIVFLHPNLRVLSQVLLTMVLAAESKEKEDELLESASETTAASGTLDATAISSGRLDANLTFPNVTDSPACFPGDVLLTGATGFMGAFILHELLKHNITTRCLVRAASPLAALERITAVLESYSLWSPEFTPLIDPIPGDISQPLLGLTEDSFVDLSTSVNTIIHSAALVDWLLPLESYVGPNIISAHEVLRLANYGLPKTVHLISTISTLPIHTGLGLVEGDMEYGYGTSKYIAERLFSAARWRGAKTCVYRLPYATASSATGHFRRDRGDFLHNLILGCLELEKFPDVDADMGAVLPVDYLAQTIVAITTRDFERVGRDYDFLNKRAVSCADFFRTVGEVRGTEVDIVPFGVWKERVMEYAESHPTSALARITAVLDNFTEVNAASIFKGSMVGKNVFGGDQYPAPSLDEAFVKAYLGQIGELGTESV